MRQKVESLNFRVAKFYQLLELTVIYKRRRKAFLVETALDSKRNLHWYRYMLLLLCILLYQLDYLMQILLGVRSY